MLANFLDMFSHPLPSLIQSLCLIQDHSFLIRTLIIILIQLIDVLIGKDLIIKSNGVLIGSISFDNFIEFDAFVAIDLIAIIIFLLCFEIL